MYIDVRIFGMDEQEMEDKLSNIIQPHALTLEHGEKAVRDIMELLMNEDEEP